MKFNFYRRNIPGLSWLTIVKKDCMDIDVYCGYNVECHDNFFAAGVWAGDFLSGGFSSSMFSCCSGAELNNGHLRFSTPSHMLEQLFSIHYGNQFLISNSLAFLLAHTGFELDENYYNYEEDLCSGLLGCEKAKKKTKLKNDHLLCIHRFCNINVDNKLRIEETKKPSIQFNDYNDYKSKILDILDELKNNAVSDARGHKYGMISTISRGYDATTVSALAKMVGCDEVLTFKSPEKYKSDCGTAIAEKLGFSKIYEVDADTYKVSKTLLEAECCATGDMGSETVFCAFDELTSGKLLFMGARGDSVWERLHDNVNGSLDFSSGNTYSQSSLTPYEHFNLTNTIVVNIPLIGATAWPDLARISNSDEMKPWSVRDTYDRPICRRIVEGAGVSRKDFGQVKAGAGMSLHFNTMKSLKNKISKKSYSSLAEFSKRLRRSKWNSVLYSFKFYCREYPIFFNFIFSKMRVPFRFNDSQCGKMSSPLSSLLVLWSTSLMMNRYK